VITPEDALAWHLLGHDAAMEFFGQKYPSAYEVRCQAREVGQGQDVPTCSDKTAATNEIGFHMSCTRPKGHKGSHAAHIGPGAVVHVW